ncbi:hypothetical protein [Christiangramia echinicola]|uniref:Uncharacterized protein n=1 Tax=Christiangramia echinicola TaxID=279359 RepID=A0A1H1PY18_9FLAO|nr:hypothetical protein [Christiangramia echinicola]SDS15887.1 hypothetical protein SAMN04488552_2296 [Christiangramia echinicola]
MKKILFPIMLVFAFYGCSVESLESSEEIITVDAKGKNTVQSADINEFEYPTEDVCVDSEATFTFNVPVGTNIQIQELIGGEWIQVTQDNGTTTNPQIYTMSWNVPGVHYFRYKAGSGGFTEIAPITVVDCSECEESFSHVTNPDGSYTFTYIPADDLENAEIIFTFAQSVVTNWVESSHETVWDHRGVTEHAFLDLVACETYEWQVILDKNCSGNSPNSNVWTNFKVNDVSKKTENTPNLTQSCN